jgi:hypothetical protein
MFEESTATAEETQQTESAETEETEVAAEESSAEAAAEESEAEAGDETAETTSDDDADWLPDEQLKVFPDEQYQRYAEKRYPELAKLLNDENLPEPTRKQVRQILHDKINTDIRIKQMAEANQEEEVAEDEVEEAAEPTRVDPAQAQAQWEQNVNTFVDRVTDPVVAEKFITDFTKAFEIKDPKERSIAATKVLTRGMVNVLKDAIPAFLFGANGQPGQLDQYIEQRYEGLGQMSEHNSRTSAWSEVKASDPKYSSLPDFDPSPNSPWSKAIAQVAEMVPGFAKFEVPGASRRENFIAKSQIAARLLAAGPSANAVAIATKAVETGKRVQAEATRAKQNARLGAGQSKGQIARSPQPDALKSRIEETRQEENPFAGVKWS